MSNRPFEKYSDDAEHIFIYTGEAQTAEESSVMKRLQKDFSSDCRISNAVNSVLAVFDDREFSAINRKYRRNIPKNPANLEIRIQDDEIQRRFLALGVPEGNFCDYILLLYYPRPHGGSDRIPPKLLKEANKRAKKCLGYIERIKK